MHNSSQLSGRLGMCASLIGSKHCQLKMPQRQWAPMQLFTDLALWENLHLVLTDRQGQLFSYLDNASIAF